MKLVYEKIGESKLPVWTLRFSKEIDGTSGKYVFYSQDDLKKFLNDNKNLFKVEDFRKTYSIDYVNEYNEIFIVRSIHE